ncbi:MAG: hypothetical protein KDJ27_03230 [Gammaproteobacteria bacterium]|nr:hypothetical protein [Gammaproteobacteria bacterium]
MNNTIIFIAGIGAIAAGYLIAMAVAASFIDNDYLCVCTGKTGGDGAQEIIMVPVSGSGQCPHQNRYNNLFCS